VPSLSAIPCSSTVVGILTCLRTFGFIAPRTSHGFAIH
jgi:hypothetical protein